MVNLLNRIIAVISLLTLFSCVYIPAKSEDQSNCILHTKKLELKVKNIDGALNCSGESCLPVLAVVSTVSLSTFIVSGSIVFVGNSFHWLEKEGTCDDGFIKIKIDEFNQFLGV